MSQFKCYPHLTAQLTSARVPLHVVTQPYVLDEELTLNCTCTLSTYIKFCSTCFGDHTKQPISKLTSLITNSQKPVLLQRTYITIAPRRSVNYVDVQSIPHCNKNHHELKSCFHSMIAW